MLVAGNRVSSSVVHVPLGRICLGSAPLSREFVKVHRTAACASFDSPLTSFALTASTNFMVRFDSQYVHRLDIELYALTADKQAIHCAYFPSLASVHVDQVKKIADQLEESERSATTENWGLFLARKEAAFRGQQQVD